jgi:hypothetical protein
VRSLPALVLARAFALVFVLALVLAFAWTTGAVAHHSFGSIYDSDRNVSLEGVVKEFQFVHPHPFLVVSVEAERGDARSWRAEMDNRFELEDIGIDARTFKPGDRVRISGSPGRNEQQILYLWKLERPSDGLLYEQVGSRPYLKKSSAGEGA